MNTLHLHSLVLCLAAPFTVMDSELHAAPLTNHALTGTATQSSTGYGGVPERAIDGNTDGHYWNESSSNTGSPASPDEWWEVDLGAPKEIGRIQVWLRTDCCTAHRSNLRVAVYDRAEPATRNVLWTRNLDNPPPDMVAFDFSPVLTGQVVRVEHIGGVMLPLTLAEVQVFNQAVPELVNYATGGVAVASSEGFGSTAASAIDGNVSGDFTPDGMYVNTTPLDPGPVWQLDLVETKPIGRIQLWMRTDYCRSCSEGLRVTVLDEGFNVLFQGVPDHSPLRSFGFSFGPVLLGRYVQVDLAPGFVSPVPPYRVLQFAELEVLGGYPDQPVISILEGPVGQTVLAGTRATFGPVSATVDGAVLPEHVSFQWQRNGVDIPGAIRPSYTTSFQSPINDQDRYRVRIMAPGYGVTSSEAELRVTPENVPPLISNATFTATARLHLALGFNEPIATATATDLTHYVFSADGVVVRAIPGMDGQSVLLDVAGLAPNADYALRVSGVADLSGNLLAPTNLVGTVDFYEINHARGGQATQSSTNHAGWPWLAIDGNRDGIYGHGSVTHNQSPEPDGWWEVDLGAEQAIGRMSLWWRTDDCCLDRTENFTLRVLDAALTPIFIQTYPGLPPSPSYVLNFPAPISGRFIRIEASDPPEGSGNVSLAEVEVIAPYDYGASIAILTNLPPERNVLQNAAATFRLATAALGAPDDRLTFQWFTNGIAVAGGVTSTFTTPPLTFADDGLIVQCRVFLPGLATNSIASRVIISTDDELPYVVAVDHAFGDSPDTVDLIVRFNERLESTSLPDIFNYVVNDRLPLDAEAGADFRSVTLTVPALDEVLGVYNIAIYGVNDLAGNVIEPVVWHGIFPFTAQNYALAGTATQSSTGFGGVPERAINGNTDSNISSGSVSHTGYPPGLNEWWEVALETVESIGRIQVWLRTDCCREHRTDLRAVVYDVADPETRRVIWSQDFGNPQPDLLAFDFTPALRGQVVRIEHYGDAALPVALAEVQVFMGMPAIQLNIIRAENQIRISWPAAVPYLVLESKSAWDAAGWNVVDQIPDLLGEQMVVTLSDPRQATFYRLRRE